MVSLILSHRNAVRKTKQIIQFRIYSGVKFQPSHGWKKEGYRDGQVVFAASPAGLDFNRLGVRGCPLAGFKGIEPLVGWKGKVEHTK